MAKKRFWVKVLLAVLLGVFSFSGTHILNVKATEWDDEEFQRLLLLDKIDAYGLEELQHAGIFDLNTTNEVTYSREYEDGTFDEIKLLVHTDINGNIIAVDSDSPITMDALKKKKPKNGKTKTNPVPYKLNGGKTESAFINKHAFDKHKYDSSKKSTPKATQYGKDVDVRKLREDTMANYDSKWTQTDLNGNTTTVYAKSYDSNLSTKDTSTKYHRVIINKKDASKSTQFPLAF